MESLTNDKFFVGAVSCEIIHKVWLSEPITYAEFSKLWLKRYKKMQK